MCIHCGTLYSMEEHILAYTAGLIDGEGYIGLGKNTSAKDSFRPEIKVTSTDRYMAPFMHQHYGGHLSYRTPLNPNHSKSMEWCLRDAINVQGFLLAVYPYLIVKKAIAEVVISYCQNCSYKKTLDKKNNKYIMLPELLESRYDHHYSLKRLNRRGATPAETE